MGAVHGCHMKYVALSLLSLLPLLASSSPMSATPLTAVLLYSAFLNMYISAAFKMRFGCEMLMKDQKTGKIPLLSYLLFFPFHIPTILYTYIHTVLGLTHGVKYGDDVLSGEGYWVGGRYAHKIKDGPSRWEVTVDLTSEFPEMCISTTGIYVNSPVWDGTPPTIENIERCAEAISRGWRGSKKKVGRGGDVMIHCAHGRGRSCLIACAGLVKSGRASDWREGFEIVQRGRRVCKLNQGMRDALERWQKKYVK